jgi:hypothetical protein
MDYPKSTTSCRSAASRPRLLPHASIGIGAEVRLREAEAADQLGLRQLRQVLPLRGVVPNSGISSITSEDCTLIIER